MKKLELALLLCMPVFLLLYSITGIYGSRNIESFSQDLDARIGEIKELKSILNENNNEEKDATFSINEKILKSSEGAYQHYAEFSSKLSSWVNRQSYTVLIISLLNIFTVLILYKRFKRNEAN